MQPNQRRTMGEVARCWAETQPDRTAYIFLGDGEAESERLTFAELDSRASSIAAELRRLNVGEGHRVLLIYPTCSDFVTALLGCFYAGATAVPAVVDKSPRALERFRRVVRDARSTVALTTDRTFRAIQQGFATAPELESMQWVPTDRMDTSGFLSAPLVTQRDSALALIQYTSGSTSEPKGIAITHANLMATNWIVHVTQATTNEQRTVTWLPIFHDLGLIGQVMQTAYIGSLCVLMPPAAFLERPARWLEAATRYRATHAAAPNFGYELCLRKIQDQEIERLDLSALSTAVIAAEPIRSSTVLAFEKRFAGCGFSSKAFVPGYGLAEATLVVSGGPLNSGARSLVVDSDSLARYQVEVVDSAEGNAKIVVACGALAPGEQLAIVEPETCRRLSDNQVGEIWVRGPHVGKGYWNNPEETERVFGARLAESGEGPFLRTGDLGFLRDGQLYVTGRFKDLIIVRGTNHYPQDIELTVEESHANLRPGCGAAFSVTIEEEEELVVAQEIRDVNADNFREIAAAIAKGVSENHGIVPHEVVLIPPRAILKTASGKVARRPCRDAYILGQLPIVFRSSDRLKQAQIGAASEWSASSTQSSASDSLQAIVENCIIAALEMPPNYRPAPDDDLYDLGLDSASAAALLYAVEKAAGLPLTMDFLAKARTPMQMVEYLRARLTIT